MVSQSSRAFLWFSLGPTLSQLLPKISQMIPSCAKQDVEQWQGGGWSSKLKPQQEKEKKCRAEWREAISVKVNVSLDVGCQRVYSTNKCERKSQKQDGICPYFLWQRREKGSVKNELMTGQGKKRKAQILWKDFRTSVIMDRFAKYHQKLFKILFGIYFIFLLRKEKSCQELVIQNLPERHT